MRLRNNNFLSKLNYFPQKGNSFNLPKITVVTPSYNQSKFLEKTILSVLNQNYPDLEYIIMDGGSTDDSVEIIKKYEKYLAYWQSKPDKGQSDAIHQGFEMATGDILAWLNSDDVYLPGALSFVGSYFHKHPNVDVIYGNYLNIDKNDNVLRETKGVPFNRLAFIMNCISWHQASIFWRKNIYSSNTVLDIEEHYIMDYDLWFQFIRSGAKFKYVNKTLSCFRDYPGTKTASIKKEKAKLLQKKIKHYFGFSIYDNKYIVLKIMYRLRTLIFHIFKGRFLYLLKDVGKGYNSG